MAVPPRARPPILLSSLLKSCGAAGELGGLVLSGRAFWCEATLFDGRPLEIRQ